MNPVLISGAIDKLEADVTLNGYIGVGHVFKGGPEAPEQIPRVRVKSGGESSKNQCGAINTRRKDALCIMQIDVWISSTGTIFPCESEDADLIQSRAEEILQNPLSPITGTHSWEKISESQQEGDGLWHNVVRFHFAAGLIDT